MELCGGAQAPLVTQRNPNCPPSTTILGGWEACRALWDMGMGSTWEGGMWGRGSWGAEPEPKIQQWPHVLMGV